MSNLPTFCRHPQDEPVLQQNKTYLLCQSSDNKAAVAIGALYEATEPQTIYFEIYFNYMCNRHPKFNKSIALLRELSTVGKLSLTRAILKEFAVLEQLQGAIG